MWQKTNDLTNDLTNDYFEKIKKGLYAWKAATCLASTQPFLRCVSCHVTYGFSCDAFPFRRGLYAR